MAARKRTAPEPVRPYLGSIDPEELSVAHRVAHQIVTSRVDLLPSIDRIMAADLDESGQERALALFRDSLGCPDDPNRDPATAISAAVAAG